MKKKWKKVNHYYKKKNFWKMIQIKKVHKIKKFNSIFRYCFSSLSVFGLNLYSNWAVNPLCCFKRCFCRSYWIWSIICLFYPAIPKEFSQLKAEASFSWRLGSCCRVCSWLRNILNFIQRRIIWCLLFAPAMANLFYFPKRWALCHFSCDLELRGAI